MPAYFSSRRYWVWVAILLVPFLVANCIVFMIDNVDIRGFPFGYAYHAHSWSPDRPDESGFSLPLLSANLAIGVISSMFLATLFSRRA